MEDAPAKRSIPQGKRFRGSERIAERAEHAVRRVAFARPHIVVEAEAELVLAQLHSRLTRKADAVQHLGLQGGLALHPGKAHVALRLDVAGGGDHAQIKRGPHAPAACRIEVL